MDNNDNIKEYYVKCEYCNSLCKFNNINEHIKNCNLNWNDEVGLLACYSCNIPYDKSLFTSSQVEKKEWLARCKECIKNNKTEKYIKFYYNNIDDELHNAVSEHNEEKVLELLQKGANPNYIRQTWVRDEKYKWYRVYDANGNEIEEDDSEMIQPKTPLRLCIFMLCSCLTKNDEKIYNIAKMLIEYGADKVEALSYFRRLYGNGEIFEDFYKLLI